MNMKTNDGGPAFPNARHYNGLGECVQFESTGMSLRDWLAGKAMVAIIGQYSVEDMAKISKDELLNGTARGSYDMADAMLAVRDKEL